MSLRTARPELAEASASLLLPVKALRPSRFSLSVYGDPAADLASDGLLESVRREGILVPLVVAPEGEGWEVISGHRRLSCARKLGLAEVACEVRELPRGETRRRAVLDYNLQRRKTFGQMMREADALETLQARAAERRRRANLRRGLSAGVSELPECRNSDDRAGRTDVVVARRLGLGGKDLYRQARAIWRASEQGDVRARALVAELNAGTKTIHGAHKDLRRRDRFTTDFQPTPYDVWNFRHDRAFGLSHPGSSPATIVAHLLHYYTEPGALVVDPMAGGGSTIDVCEGMGRRCYAYDIQPVRPDIRINDVRHGFPPEAGGCDLVYCDPPYHTMLAAAYGPASVSAEPWTGWTRFLEELARRTFEVLRPGGFVAILVANQTEKDLPAGVGYLDHAFVAYGALVQAGFRPERRVSCPMSGGYRPQQVRKARVEGRMLGLVRDLLIMRKPVEAGQLSVSTIGSPPANS